MRISTDKFNAKEVHMNSSQRQISAHNRRILVLGEGRESLDIILEPLRWEMYDARGVVSLSEALQLFESWVPHLVLIERNPDHEGLTFLKKIKEKVQFASCIFISEDSKTESIITGLDEGGDDYIVKPFVPLELLARVRTLLRVKDLQEQLLLANERLKELVDTDDLTGLYNMRSLYQRLDLEIDRAKRFGRPVTVVMLDMDHFKSVNDGHDHLFGSYVISEVGKIIRSNTRNIDLPARYGGDEFLVVLTETSVEGAVMFCQRLRKAVQGTTFRSGEDSINLTISLGFVVLDSQEEISAKELVRRADHALYEAKESGRNKVIQWSEVIHRKAGKKAS